MRERARRFGTGVIIPCLLQLSEVQGVEAGGQIRLCPCWPHRDYLDVEVLAAGDGCCDSQAPGNLMGEVRVLAEQFKQPVCRSRRRNSTPLPASYSLGARAKDRFKLKLVVPKTGSNLL